MKSIYKKSYSGILRTMIVSAVVFSFMGCNAYLNTLYNGKSSFREARVLHQKKARNFPDSLLVTAPTEAVPKYERTVEKSIKVLEAFPKKKKWHDDALMLMGEAYYYKKDFQKAVRRFRELQTDFPLSKFVPESFIYMGMCYIEDGNYDKAEETLEMVLSKYPQYDKDQQVTMLLVEIAVRREGRGEAIALLEKSMKSARTEQKRIEIILRISQLYIDMKQYQKALPLLQSAPRKKDYPEQAYRLDKNLLICYRETGKYDEALKLISFMASSRLYTAHTDEILYEKGLILKALEKYDDAIDVFKILCKGVDSTTVKNDTASFKSKGFYELGLIYQLKKSNYKQAKEYFSIASKGTDTLVRRPASRRVTAMKKLDSLRNIKGTAADKKDSNDLRAILIGELFRFDLDEPDSAYNEYLKITQDTTAAKATAAKAFCAAALITRDDKKDSAKADSLFRIVIKEYPESEYAQLAQKELKIPVTIHTRSDSALAAYKAAEELFYRDNDIKGAVQAFYDIYRNYPELDIAPKSLYAAAWYSDNVLQKKNTAKQLYEKICAKYKATIYCSGVSEPRLKTVRDTLAILNELRKKQEQKKDKVSAKTPASSAKPVSDTSVIADSLKSDKSSIQDTDLFQADDNIDKSEEKRSDSAAASNKPVAGDSVKQEKK